jgi:hypothetical protein
MLPLKTRRKADIVVSILFIVFGVYIIYEAMQMPWSRGRFAWYASPGLFPTVIGVLLILFSLRVFLVAFREGGHRNIARPLWQWIVGLPRNRGIHRVTFTIVWIGLYVFYGVGHYNYQIVSAIFLAVFIGVFWLSGAGSQWPKRLAVTIAVSVSVPVVIAYIFSTYLYVPAP